jgi:hypothetical protein
MAQFTAPCAECMKTTFHSALFTEVRDTKFGNERYRLLKCAGCGAVSLEVNSLGDESGLVKNEYYPSPVSRRVPMWSAFLQLGIIGNSAEDGAIGELLTEIYAAVRGGQLRLAVMGIRALLEQVMILKVGDEGSFTKNLKLFHERDHISEAQRNQMEIILDAGHAATHRLYRPKEEDLNIALDIAEGILAAIYAHTDAAAQLAQRVPPRPNPQLKSKD